MAALIVENRGNTLAVTGNTFPVRRSIALLGGKWDAARKTWFVPTHQARAVYELAGLATPLVVEDDTVPCNNCGELGDAGQECWHCHGQGWHQPRF
jgi:hypothetical protein